MPVHAQSESGHELLAENLPGMYRLEFLCHSVLLVVIDNLIGVSVPPPKADAPLIVDADAVLTFAVSLQRLQPKWRWICASRSAHGPSMGAAASLRTPHSASRVISKTALPSG